MFIKLNHVEVRSLISLLEDIDMDVDSENKLTGLEKQALDKLRLIYQAQAQKDARNRLETSSTVSPIRSHSTRMEGRRQLVGGMQEGM